MFACVSGAVLVDLQVIAAMLSHPGLRQSMLTQQPADTSLPRMLLHLFAAPHVTAESIGMMQRPLTPATTGMPVSSGGITARKSAVGGAMHEQGTAGAIGTTAASVGVVTPRKGGSAITAPGSAQKVGGCQNRHSAKQIHSTYSLSARVMHT